MAIVADAASEVRRLAAQAWRRGFRARRSIWGAAPSAPACGVCDVVSFPCSGHAWEDGEGPQLDEQPSSGGQGRCP